LKERRRFEVVDVIGRIILVLDLKEIRCESLDITQQDSDRIQWQADGNRPSGYVKSREYFEQLRTDLPKDCALWSSLIRQFSYVLLIRTGNVL
jgi:hypothetical protein